MSTTASFPPEVVPTPGPWSLKGEAWWFILSLNAKAGKLAEGNFAPLEAQSRELGEEPGAYRGGLSVVMLIRYKESPIGPYDELMMVPGTFTVPKEHGGGTGMRITRTYVSTLASVANGRHNWNVPKHLARFSFLPYPNTSPSDSKDETKQSSSTQVRIYDVIPNTSPPEFEATPFFSAIMHPYPVLSVLPAIPFNVWLMRAIYNTDLLQPPLEESETANKDGLVGTQGWSKVTPGYTGTIKMCSVQGALETDENSEGSKRERFGDGKRFPDVSPWKLAVHWTECNITFPVGTWPKTP